MSMYTHQTDQGKFLASLQSMMQAHLPEGGVAIPYGRNTHIEVVDVATGQVWMSVQPVTRVESDRLKSGLDDSLQVVGIGTASMDAALFRYSPEGDGEPVRERDIGGRRFINVALPGEPRILAGGMMQMAVNKAHVVGFEAGRALTIMRLPDGDFVEIVGSPLHDNELPLPDGARLQKIVLREPWVLELPTPTIAFFCNCSGLRSFQGPVILPI